jgi:hypothetical protein
MRLKGLIKTWRIAGSRVFAELFGGISLNGAERDVLTTLVYGAAIAIDASVGNNFQVSITDGVAFVVSAPTNPPETGRSQLMSIKFKNTSGGAHGAGTWNAIFKTQAAVFPAIATGFSRTVQFIWDGTNWVEVGRSAADVAN